MKRKKNNVSISSSNKKTKSRDSELAQFLSPVGISLRQDRHCSSSDIDTVVRELSVKLLDTQARDNFFIMLQDYIDEVENLKVAMLPLVKEDSTTHFNSDSLIKILLRVPSISEQLTELLLEKLPLVAEDRTCNIAALTVSQLRWMNSLSYDVIITKLNEVLPVCPLPVQKEMISGLPEILPDEKHEEACELLLDHISTLDLVPCILETLSELSLSHKILDKVHEAVEVQLCALSADSVPAALRFLLSTAPPDKAVSSIRQHIDFQSLCKSGEGMEAEELSMECLEQVLRFHNKIQKCWLSLLHSSSSLSVFDLLVYLILYRVNNKPKTVLSSIRFHLKEGTFNASLVQDLYRNHAKTAALFNSEQLKIAHSLLLSFPEHSLPSLLYLSVFTHGDLHAQQEVVGSLISHIGSGQSKEVDSGIRTLGLIKDSTDKSVDRFSSLLNGLLDYLNTLSIPQAREVLYLLVRISSAGSCRTVDDIHIITRKYLSHSSTKLRKLGIIGSCSLVQALSVESTDKAKTFISKVQESLSRAPELEALFYDELASCVGNGCVDRETVQLIYDTYVDKFQSDFVSREPVDSTSQVCDILCLEGADTLENDETGHISINLWNCVEAENPTQLMVLCPLLRLVGTSLAILENSMEDIDSILGCYIRALPLDDIVTCERSTVGLLALINLVIEQINVFHVERRPSMRNKLVKRIKLLQELLGLLRKVPVVDDMVPMVFDLAEDLGTSKSKKGQSSKSTLNDSAADVSKDMSLFDPTKTGTMKTSTQLDKSENDVEAGAAAVTKPKKHVSSWSSGVKFRGFIRELDIRTMAILNLSIESTLQSNESSAQSEVEPMTLGLPETCMMLEDLLSKCKFKLKPASVFSKPENSLGFSRVASLSETKFTQQILSILPALCQTMEDNVSQPKETSSDSQETSQNQSAMNSTLEEIAMLEDNPFGVKTFELVFSILELVFSWSGFATNSQISTECFSILASRTQNQTQGPLSVRRKHALHYLLNFEKSCQSFSSTINLLKCCSVISDSKDQRISDICKSCLQREWDITEDEKENKVRFNEGVGYLVRTFLSHSSENQGDLLDLLVEQLDVVVKKDEDVEKIFPTFTRATLPTIYKIVLTKLVEYQKSISSDKENGLDILTNCVGNFANLITYIKIIESRPLLRSALLYGQKFLESFLAIGLPLLSPMISDNYVEVQSILKKIQTSTRQLHHATTHSKSLKDIALTARVPLLKKFLEAFLLKVKAIFAHHGCTDAFWVGNLKQRNLKGEEIVSQQVEEEEEEEGDVDDLSELSIDTDDEDNNSRAAPDDENSDSMSIGY